MKPWEKFAWAGLLLICLLTRLIDLDSRALAHDEAIHASLAHSFVEDGVYRQDPAYHGPLLYHLIGASFMVLGESDAAARTPVAVCAVLVLLMLVLLRRYLGPLAALSSAGFMLISPTLLVYGRYARNDLLMATFSLLWVYALFRYLEHRSGRWLWALGGSMLLAFATKETAFLTGAGFGLFALAIWLRDPLGKRREDSSAAGDLVVSMFTLVLPFAAGGLVLFGWPALDDGSEALLQRSVWVVLSLALLSLSAAYCWFGLGPGRVLRGGPGFKLWMGVAGGFWLGLLLLFSGALTNVRTGFVNGFVGSLGYWLEQHDVGRGGQPFFYYPMLLVVYEFLPLLLTAVGVVWLIRGVGPLTNARPETVIVPSGREESAVVLEAGKWPRVFLDFLVWWAFFSLVAYSVAGEKMPWLLVHIVLPMIVLSGWVVARLVDLLTTPSLRQGQILVVGFLLPVALVAVLDPVPFRSADTEGVVQTMRWVSALFAVGLVGSCCFFLARKDGTWKRWVAAGALVCLALFSARTALRAAYVNDEHANELLVYAHSTPDIKRVLTQIERLQKNHGDAPLRVVYDETTSWPFAWYLRHQAGVRMVDSNALSLGRADVVLASSNPQDAVWLATAAGFESSTYTRIWWPPEDYRFWGVGELMRRATRWESWSNFKDILLYRRYPHVKLSEWPSRDDFKLHIRRELISGSQSESGERPAVQSGGPVTQSTRLIRKDPIEILTGPFNGSALKAPADIQFRPEGGLIVADSGNDRVLALRADGSLEYVVDSAGGRALREPWGVGVAPNGSVAIADTWNHRVVVVDPGGAILAVWPSPASMPLVLEETPLYGPRDVAWYPTAAEGTSNASETGSTGSWIVADTGNHRLLQVRGVDATDGEVSVLAGLREPTSVGVSGEALVVADAWNAAIRWFPLDGPANAERPRLEELSGARDSVVWRVPGWGSRDARHKPYLTVGSSQSVAGEELFVSDPESGRVLRFAANGTLHEAWSLNADNSTSTAKTPREVGPVGVALGRQRAWASAALREDESASLLAVADSAGNRVLIYRISDALSEEINH